eukprot:1190470-Prorocentrum_minimum.AAC.5
MRRTRPVVERRHPRGFCAEVRIKARALKRRREGALWGGNFRGGTFIRGSQRNAVPPAGDRLDRRKGPRAHDHQRRCQGTLAPLPDGGHRGGLLGAIRDAPAVRGLGALARLAPLDQLGSVGPVLLSKRGVVPPRGPIT